MRISSINKSIEVENYLKESKGNERRSGGGEGGIKLES